MSRTKRKTACNYTNTISPWLTEAMEHGDTRHGARTLPHMPRAIRHHLRVDQSFKGWGPGHTGLQLKVPDMTHAVLIPRRGDRVGSRLTRQLSQAKADAHLLTALAFSVPESKGPFLTRRPPQGPTWSASLMHFPVWSAAGSGPLGVNEPSKGFPDGPGLTQFMPQGQGSREGHQVHWQSLLSAPGCSPKPTHSQTEVQVHGFPKLPLVP